MQDIPKKRKFLSRFGWAWIVSIVIYVILRQYPGFFSFVPADYYETIKTIVLWFAIILFAFYIYDERWFRPK